MSANETLIHEALIRCVALFSLAMRQMIENHDAGDDTDYHVIARNALEYAKEQLGELP